MEELNLINDDNESTLRLHTQFSSMHKFQNKFSMIAVNVKSIVAITSNVLIF